MFSFNSSIEEIPKIGSSFQKKLKRMNIKTVEDLVFHFPHRYEDFSEIKAINKVKAGKESCIIGRIKEIKNSRTWKKKMAITEAIVEDESGPIKTIWFNQSYLANILQKGNRVCLAGKVSFDKNGFYFSNPVFEKLSSENQDFIHTGRIVPVYPETKGVSSRWLRYIIYPLLKKIKLPEILPKEIISQNNLMPLKKAIWQIHFPDSFPKAEKAKKRFSFQELFLIELTVLKKKMELNREESPSIPIDVKLIKKFVNSLSFKLTDAQKKCIWRILKDLEKPRPMSRLLQGDVGSGKTLVAVAPALNVVKKGWQTAFMAPTEILAKQHFKEVSKLLQSFKVRIALLTGKQDKMNSIKLPGETIEISRKKVLEKIKEREIDILIGTHALIQDKVKFGKLAFIVVDEQHRFGIKQRALLAKNSKEKKIPHFLSMTATPIPRSLALTIYGDLDISILDEMPKGRKKIITKIIPPKERTETYNFMKKRIKKGEQIFVICPRIESSEEKNSPWGNVKAVEEEYEKLSKEIFPQFKVEMLHGKMKTKEKERKMIEFKNKKIDVLVSTSVVEVGIDIPKATIMAIEGVDRFGLAQLHQFRGRVGRSNIQSYCFLFSDSPSSKTKKRLKAITKAEDGFELAEKDLKIRGPGSLTGLKQSGLPDLAMEKLQDMELVEKTRESAQKFLEENPLLNNYPLLKRNSERISREIHLE